MRVAFFRMMARNSRACGEFCSLPSSKVSTYPEMEVSGVRSSCDTLAIKSRRVFSARSTLVTSCSTATAPPPGVGAALTSKIRPGNTVSALPLKLTRSLSAPSTQASTSGSRSSSTRRRPSSTALGLMRCITAFDQMTCPCAFTATTASCILSSSAASSRRLASSA